MSTRSLIRHLAASSDADVVAAAMFERDVTLWDVRAPARLASFETVLDFGGARLALDRHATRCVAAAYSRRGIACYSTADGSLIWERMDLKRTQYLTASPNGELIYSSGEGRSCVALDLETGRTVETLRGAALVVTSPYDNARFIDKHQPAIQLTSSSRRIIPIQRDTFAFLDVAFGPHQLCTTESGGSTRCHDIHTGAEIWKYVPPQGVHVLGVSYSISGRCFVGVQWSYERGGPKQLLRLGIATEVVACIGQPATSVFCCGADLLLTSDGNIFETTSGQLRTQLPFGSIGTTHPQ